MMIQSQSLSLYSFWDVLKEYFQALDHNGLYLHQAELEIEATLIFASRIVVLSVVIHLKTVYSSEVHKDLVITSQRRDIDDF